MAMAQKQPTTSPPTRWQRTCRWLWRSMTILWSVIIAGIAFSTIANIFTTSTATPLSQLYIIHWVAIYHIPLFLVAGGLVLLTVVSWLGSRLHKASSYLSPDQQSRLVILKSLRKAYTDELNSSLQGMARIALGLHERFDLTHPTRLSSWQPAQSEHTLPHGITIADAYDQAGNGLLILGEPGAGKSTLLYDLAQALLLRTEQDESYPLPIILNLSSWATRRLPLEQWIVEELQRRYLIPRQHSQHWLQQSKLLLLLDGLDEVAASARDACIKAINIYQSEHLTPLVVCSRREEYQALSERLTLQSAVIIQPLSSEQVNDYLVRAGQALAAVQTVMNTNPVFQKLLTTPLLLSVVMLTYKGKAAKDLPELGSAEDQQHQVFERYVTRMLERQTREWHYTPHQTYQWLIWLAQRMQQYSLTEFYLERLLPTWLETKRLRILYRLYFGLVGGLGAMLFVGLVLELTRAPIGGLIFVPIMGLLVAVLFMLSFGFLGNQRIIYAEVLTWSWRSFWRAVRTNLIGGLFGGLLYALFYGWFHGLIAGLLVVLIYGLIGGVLSVRISEHLRIRPNQGIHSSGWNGIRIGLISGLVVGLGGGVVFKVLGGSDYNLFTGLYFGLIAGLFGWVYFGGAAYLQHYILRYILWRSGAIPWHYVRFLEEATQRVLLQSVGGGYRFIHPLIQQYFASLTIAAPSSDIQQRLFGK